MFMNEEWKSVIGYEEYYEVSNLGNVRSVDRIVGAAHGGTKRILGVTLRPCIGNHGNNYRFVNLRKLHTGKTVKVARLVAESFIPNPSHLPCIDHINCIKTDDSVTNLQWVTHAENMRRAGANLLMKPARGESAWNSKLSDSDITTILLLRHQGHSFAYIARSLNVGQTIIRGVVAGTRWKHVPRI